MKLSEAHEIIEATIGMFRQFAHEKTLGLAIRGEDFMQLPVKSSFENYYDADTLEIHIEERVYYTFENDNGEQKKYIENIRPVCDYLIEEWPSPKGCKVRKWLMKAYDHCYKVSEQLLEEQDLYYATDWEPETYSFTRRTQHSSRNIRIFVVDTLHEMHRAIKATEDGETIDMPPRSEKDFVSNDEIEASLHPEIQREIYDSYVKTHQNKRHKPVKKFREFVKDAEQTEEVMGKLHRLIGNKKDSDALKIIAEAMWIELLDKPTGTSIKKEFPSVTCSATLISRCLKEPMPTIQKELDKIKRKFEKA